MTTIRNLLTGRTLQSVTHHVADGICPVQVSTVTELDGTIVDVTLDDPARAFRITRALSVDDLLGGGFVPPCPAGRGEPGPVLPPNRPARPAHPSIQDREQR
jgi:hypothetical protein